MSAPRLLYATANALQVASGPQAANQAWTSGISINLSLLSQSPYLLVHALNMSASATLAAGFVAVYQKLQWQLKLVDAAITAGSNLTGDANKIMYGQFQNVQFTQPVRVKSAGLVQLFQMDVDCNGSRAFAAGDSLFTSVTITYEVPIDDGSGDSVPGTQKSIVNPNAAPRFKFEKQQ